MNRHCLSVTAALLLASAAMGAWAQNTAPTTVPASPSAVAPTAAPAQPAASSTAKPALKADAKTAAAATATAAKPGIVVTDAPLAPAKPRPLPVQRTVPDSREAATMPNELRPQEPVTSQVNIPLGRTPAAPARTATPSSGVNDTAGRCLAMADATERALCREREGTAAPKPKK